MRSVTWRQPVSLVGERVLVRTPRPGDQAILERLRADPEIDHYMGVDPGTGLLWRQVFLGENSGSLADLVISAASGDEAPIGLISLWDRSIPHQAAELSIWIGQGHRNGGAGTEALRLALRHAFGPMGLHKVYLRVLEYNARAIRTYEKCGFKIEGTLRDEMRVQGRWHNLIYMGALSDDFTPLDASPTHWST
ncbi:MAG TPA: GNAT family protein [Chloroflexota bacterium]|nr:GNAT family protein [Chloroflexota bacterium]